MNYITNPFKMKLQRREFWVRWKWCKVTSLPNLNQTLQYNKKTHHNKKKHQNSCIKMKKTNQNKDNQRG